MRFMTLVLLALAFSVAACDSDAANDADADAHSSETPAAEACEHSKEGPYKDVTAAADATGAPSITFEHTAVRVALGDLEGQKGGYVTFTADEDGEFAFFAGPSVSMAVTDAAGAAVAAESEEAVSECTEVAVSRKYDLKVGTYTIKLGPTAETTVTIVAEHLGAHSDG